MTSQKSKKRHPQECLGKHIAASYVLPSSYRAAFCKHLQISAHPFPASLFLQDPIVQRGADEILNQMRSITGGCPAYVMYSYEERLKVAKLQN